MAAALVHYSYGEASFGFASGGGLGLSPYEIGPFTVAEVLQNDGARAETRYYEQLSCDWLAGSNEWVSGQHPIHTYRVPGINK